MGDDQGDGGLHRRMGGGAEDSVDRLSFVVPAAVEGIRIIRGGRRGVAPGLLLEEEGIDFFEEGVQLGPERRRATDTVEVRCKGGK